MKYNGHTRVICIHRDKFKVTRRSKLTSVGSAKSKKYAYKIMLVSTFDRTFLNFPSIMSYFLTHYVGIQVNISLQVTLFAAFLK